MAAYYWIKLYDEILDDPKMGRLSDGAFRLAISLFLLAGRQESRDGRLPDIEDVAWALRLSSDLFGQYWQELERAGIVHLEDGNPVVTNFEKRQSALSPAEKQKRYRDRKRQEALQDSYHDEYTNVTDSVTKSNTEIEREIDKEEDEEKEGSLSSSDPTIEDVYQMYGNEVGTLSKVISDSIEIAVEEHGSQTVIDAIKTAVYRQKRNWAYVEGILRNWRVEGRDTRNGNKPKNGGNQWTPA